MCIRDSNFGVRPIDQHIKGFEAMGAMVEQSGGYVCADAPKGGLRGGHIYLDIVSVGATMNILLAAVLCSGMTIIENCAKEPHICLLYTSGKLLLFGQVAYLVPQELPEIKGLRVLRAGLELGQTMKNRFEPAHAWALWLKGLENSVSLAADAPELGQYLSGNVLPSGLCGWTLVRVDGLSLGWAKGDGTQLKNHYPKALRRPV